MKSNWKKYLIVTGLISIVLAFFIPEISEYISYYSTQHNPLGSGLDINIYGALWFLFYRTLFWFGIFYPSLILLRVIYSLIGNNKSELQ
jgi:hypothetical protein